MHETFRPKANLAWAILAYLLLAIYLIQSVFYPVSVDNILINISIVFSLGVLAYLIWVRPRIVLREADLIVFNPFSKIIINYRDIKGLATRWVLTIDTEVQQVKVWVAPTNTRRQGLSKSAIKLKGINAGVERPNISDGELAAQLIQARIDSLH